MIGTAVVVEILAVVIGDNRLFYIVLGLIGWFEHGTG